MDRRPQPPPLSVGLAGFDELVGAGLRAFIASDPGVTLAPGELDVDRPLPERAPDVAILDLRSLRGVGQLYRLSRSRPQTVIIVLADEPMREDIAQLLCAGARTCLPTRIGRRDLLDAIRYAARGLAILHHPSTSRARGPARFELLTARELEVCRLMGAGNTNTTIAAALCVSVETVNSHAKRVLAKLGVKSRHELAEFATRNNRPSHSDGPPLRLAFTSPRRSRPRPRSWPPTATLVVVHRRAIAV